RDELDVCMEEKKMDFGSPQGYFYHWSLSVELSWG
ncbi:MAG: hypothetical protein ACI92B_001750, partial [Marinobacter maritimus]